MKKVFTLATWVLFAVSISLAAPARSSGNPPGNILLTQDGKPKAVIVLGDSARADGLAARALISHVKHMSGATLATIAASEIGAVKLKNGRIVSSNGKIDAEAFILLGESE